jgi:RNA-directed DNA polymerase
MEQILFNKLKYWGKRKLNSRTLRPVYDKFWHKMDGRRQFTFKDCKGEYVTLSLYRKIAKGTSLVKSIKVKGDVSIYNGDLKYWSRRVIIFDLKTQTKTELLKRQDSKCSFCGQIFLPFDISEIKHITLIINY